MLADLPDLSCLSLAPTPVGETLLDKLATEDGGKTKGCDKNEFPITSTSYDSTNCAFDGYLMVKTKLDFASTSQFDSSALNRNYEVEDILGKMCTMKALPRYPDYCPKELKALTVKQRGDQLERRTNLFKRENEAYLLLQQNFRWRCIQDKKTGVGLGYDNNIANLCKYTDFYYIDKSEAKTRHGNKNTPPPQHQQPVPGDSDARNKLRAKTDRGFIFLSVLGSEDRKKELELPSEGIYKEPYLYIIVVCAADFPGYGRVLMSLAERFAAQIGLNRIVLAGLPNALGAYWGLGYRFYPWDAKKEFPVKEPYLRKDFRTKKEFLQWDVDDGLQNKLQEADAEGRRQKRDREEEEGEAEGEAEG